MALVLIVFLCAYICKEKRLRNLIIEWKKVLCVRAGEYELSQSDNRLHLRNWYEHSENTHYRGDHWSPACKAHRLTSGRGDPSPTKRYSFYTVIRFHSRFFFVSVGAKKKLSKETPKTRGNFLKKVSSGLLQKLSDNCRRDVRRSHPKQCVSLQAPRGADLSSVAFWAIKTKFDEYLSVICVY